MSIGVFSKGHNSVKMQVALWFLSAHLLIRLYISTNFCENISEDLGVIKRTLF